MIACYIGLLVFGAALFIAVITGTTDLPRWACIFNFVPLLIVFTPLRIGGTGNWCSADIFTAPLILI